MTRLRAPTTTTIWYVQHISNRGPVTDQHDTEQAATRQHAHLTTSRVPAVMWAGTVIHEPTTEEQAA